MNLMLGLPETMSLEDPARGRSAGLPRPIDAVIKLGGDVLEGDALAAVAADIARAGASRRLVVVHGGGPQATALASKLGLESRLVGGRRDHRRGHARRDEDGGRRAGSTSIWCPRCAPPACRRSGSSGSSGVIRAHRRPPRVVSGAAEAVDFGLVGDVDGFDLALLAALDAAAAVPVIACLAAGAPGEVLNINADVVASQLAAASGAAALVACTAVGGVRADKDDPATVLRRLTVAEARAAIADGTVQGG